MKGTDVRYGWIITSLCFILLIIGLNSCDEQQPFQPPDPVDKFLHGRVTDDVGNPIPNVAVMIYSQDAAIGGGNYQASLVTDNEGEWEETLSIAITQTYTIVYSRSGLLDLIQSQIVPLGVPDTVDVGTVAIPPADIDDTLRVVLTWASVPPDLDAHLTGPKGDGSRFHIYWGNRVASSTDGEPIAELISDRRNGFGPETIGIKKLIPGSDNYRFSVHNYSRNQVEGDTTLVGLSNARVRVFSPHGLEHEFSISGDDGPPTSVGNTWRVFEINGETGEITFVNQMYDGISFDEEEVFRIEEKPERLTIPGK